MQAIDLKPFGGIHVTFKCRFVKLDDYLDLELKTLAKMVVYVIICNLTFRSLVRLELGNYSGALQDAKEALILAPGYTEVTQILLFFSKLHREASLRKLWDHNGYQCPC